MTVRADWPRRAAAAFFALLTGVWAYNRGVAMTGKFDDQK